MTGGSQPTVMTGEEFAVFSSRPQVRVLLILVVLGIVGITSGVRHGFDQSAIILALGSVAGIAGTLALGRQILLDACGRRAKSMSASLRAGAGFIPYLVAVYVTFYEGLWKLLALFRDFSFASLLGRAAFIYLGYRLAVNLMHLSELPGHLSNGRVVVTDPPIKRAS
jgi:hypothetical protein